MKTLLSAIFALILATVQAVAADRITATVTITNTAIEDDTFIIVADTRTWKDSVSTPATEVLTGADAEETTTNLVNHLLATPPSGVAVYQLGADSFRLDGRTGAALDITGAGDYFEVTYSTQTVATAYDVIVPYTTTPSVRRQTITEGIVDWLNLASGKALFENSASVSNLVGRTNSQSISGAKIWTGSNTYTGPLTATNHLYLSGSDIVGVRRITNAFGNVVAEFNEDNATIGTAGAELAFSDSSAAFNVPLTGDGANLTNAVDLVAGRNFEITTNATSRVFTLGMSATTTNLITSGTNSFSDIAFRRYAITSLANGNNAGIVIGTNTFVEVSGPSAAFAINGMTGSPSRDGHLVVVVNQTGFDMTVAHQSGTDPTAANRIITMTGADRATTGNGAATLIYSAAAARWLLVAFDP